MKIKQLSFTNFRGFEKFEIPLSTTEPTVITGPNGSGKSSILYGLETLLTGNNPVTGKTSLAGLPHRGASRSEITAVTEEIGEVTRVLLPTHSLHLESATGLKLTQAQARLTQACGASEKEISYCLRGASFLSLDAKDQTARWWEWLGIKLEAAEITEELKKEPLPLLDALKTFGIRVGSDLSRLYKACYDERTARKRELANAKKELENLEAHLDGNEPDSEQPNPQLLAELRAKRHELTLSLGEARARQEQLQRLRRQVQAAPSSEAVELAKQRLESLKSELEAGAKLAERVRELQTILAEAVCPRCKRPFDQHTAEEAREELVGLEPRIPDLGSLRGRIKKGVDYLLEAGQAASLRRQLEDLEAAEAPDASTVEAELAQVEAELAVLVADEAAWAEHDRWIKTAKVAAKKVVELEGQVECLERLVTLTKDGPGGIRARVLRQHLDSVSEQLTGTLSNWGLAARLTDALTIEVMRDGEWRDYESLSDGEGLLVAIALQVWLCEITGLRILVMDRAEALDHENQELLYAACEQLLEVGAIDHAIICGVGLEHSEAIVLGEVMKEVAV